MCLLGDIERKKKEVIKRKEDVHAAKDHLKDLLPILASVWENKKVVVNVDNSMIYFYFNDVYVNFINKIQVFLTLVRMIYLFTCLNLTILNILFT